MKSSYRSLLLVAAGIFALAVGSSAHAGQGAAYWQNRSAAAKASKAPVTEVATTTKTADKSATLSAEKCTSGSCCSVNKAGS
ncbi:MAG: hypothetical protein WC205_19260 [Opitutaceae bacterium]|jgi:fructoselysine-6-P-deglycase FrlB-like protein